MTLFKRFKRIALAATACLCWLLATPATAAEGIAVQHAELVAGDDNWQLNADFDIGFNPTLEEAVSKGLSLYFVLEFELTRPRWYWFSDRAASMQQSYRLSFNALTRQYRLSIGSLYQNFTNFHDAVRVLGRIRSKPVVEKGALRRDTTYQAAVRMRLDTSQLPKPFQVNALASSKWNLTSDWYYWEVTP